VPGPRAVENDLQNLKSKKWGRKQIVEKMGNHHKAGQDWFLEDSRAKK
jgi:hypothetical protein